MGRASLSLTDTFSMSRRRKNGRDPIYCVRQFIEGYPPPLNPCTCVHGCRNTRDFPLVYARIPLKELIDAINWVPTLLGRLVKNVSGREIFLPACPIDVAGIETNCCHHTNFCDLYHWQRPNS